MSKISIRKRNRAHLHLPDGTPRALAHSADEAASRVKGAAEEVGNRVASTAGRAGEEVGELAERASERANELVARGSATADRARKELTGSRRKRWLRRSRKAALQAQNQLVDTGLAKQVSRQVSKQLSDLRTELHSELAEQSAEFGRALDSVDAAIKATRKAGARRRRNMIAGLALGAGLMYHFDPERGRERRAGTAHLVNATTARFVNQTVGDQET
jgi:hypothetical protein